MLLWSGTLTYFSKAQLKRWRGLDQRGVCVLFNNPQTNRPIDGVEDAEDHRKQDQEGSVNLEQTKLEQRLFAHYNRPAVFNC
jgi:hypothetical protein